MDRVRDYIWIEADTPRDLRLRILREVAERHDLPSSLLLSTTRRAEVIAAKREAMAAIRDRLGDSYPMIGRFFACDHTTILFHIKKYREAAHAG